MSDLANLLLAVSGSLREKVIVEMQNEIQDLRRSLHDQRRQSQQVAITGPNGTPVYAAAYLQDGTFDSSSPELWRVEFDNAHEGTTSLRSTALSKQSPSAPAAALDWTVASSSATARPTHRTPPTFAHCALSDLCNMEVRLGGICKARLCCNNGDAAGSVVEGFVNDVSNNYDAALRSGMVSLWFGGPSGVWLNIRLSPIDRDAYASLRDMDLNGGGDGGGLGPAAAIGVGGGVGENHNGGNNNNALWNTLMAVLNEDAAVQFTEVSFMIRYINGAMEAWGMPTAPPIEQHHHDDEQAHASRWIHGRQEQQHQRQDNGDTTYAGDDDSVDGRTSAASTQGTVTTSGSFGWSRNDGSLDGSTVRASNRTTSAAAENIRNSRRQRGRRNVGGRHTRHGNNPNRLVEV